MQIVSDSKRVLREIYDLLDDNSYTLVINVPMDETSKKLNMSKEYLNLCIHYLILGEYVTGDFIFVHQKNSSKEIIFTAKGIEKVENSTL